MMNILDEVSCKKKNDICVTQRKRGKGDEGEKAKEKVIY
jgi:hypothetical protein